MNCVYWTSLCFSEWLSFEKDQCFWNKIEWNEPNSVGSTDIHRTLILHHAFQPLSKLNPWYDAGTFSDIFHLCVIFEALDVVFSKSFSLFLKPSFRILYLVFGRGSKYHSFWHFHFISTYKFLSPSHILSSSIKQTLKQSNKFSLSLLVIMYDVTFFKFYFICMFHLHCRVSSKSQTT